MHDEKDSQFLGKPKELSLMADGEDFEKGWDIVASFLRD